MSSYTTSLHPHFLRTLKEIIQFLWGCLKNRYGGARGNLRTCHSLLEDPYQYRVDPSGKNDPWNIHHDASSVPIVCQTHVLVQTVSGRPTWCAVLISKTVLLGKCRKWHWIWNDTSKETATALQTMSWTHFNWLQSMFKVCTNLSTSSLVAGWWGERFRCWIPLVNKKSSKLLAVNWGPLLERDQLLGQAITHK